MKQLQKLIVQASLCMGFSNVGLFIILILNSLIIDYSEIVLVTSKLNNNKPNTLKNLQLSSGLSDGYRDRSKNEWRFKAIQKLWKERQSMDKTPIFEFNAIKDALIIFKNETASKTHSSKHRYAWALVMWALLEGYIDSNTTVYEASTGNAAFSEAYLCNLIGIKFIAILPDNVEQTKVDNIISYGGNFLKVSPENKLNFAMAEAKRNNGFFMNQCANSNKAEEFHNSGDYSKESVNVFYEILKQLKPKKIVPDYFVHAVGTGGTISSVGRYVKKYALPTQVVLVDTEFSILYDVYMYDRFTNESGAHLWVEPGINSIGNGLMGPAIIDKTTSLIPSVIDRAIKVPDLATTASIHILHDYYGIDAGLSTGINFLASLKIIYDHLKNSTIKNEQPVVVATLLADQG